MNHHHLAALLLSMTAQAAIADRLTDPTRPATARAVATETIGGLKVEAIMNSGNRRLAIVNGKVVRDGDSVDGARIDEVFSDGVRYTRAGQALVARIGKQGIDVRTHVTAHEDQS